MTRDEFDLLVHRYFEGSLTAQEESVFWERVRTDPGAADRFVEMSELESGMVESLKADDEMPSDIYAAVHGTRRRIRIPRPEPERPAWPYWAAAALFFIAVTLYLAVGPNRGAEPLRGEPVAATPMAPFPLERPERALDPHPADGVQKELEAERARRQEALREFKRQQVLLDQALREAAAQREVEKQRELEQTLARVEAQRQEEEKKLARLKATLDKPPAAPPVGTPTALAALERVEGDVRWTGSSGQAARPGDPVPSGSGVETRGPRSLAVLKLADGTRLELREDARLEQARAEGEAKTFSLARGVLEAAVAKQIGTRGIIFLTPHAEISILGTRFLISVGSDSTRLDVEEGRVRNRRLSDGRVVEVPANHSVTTGRGGGPLVARPTPWVRSFQDGVFPGPEYAGTRDTALLSSAPSTPGGSQNALRLCRDTVVDRDGTIGQTAVLVRWDIASIPPRSRVVAAELSFWVTGSVVGSGGARAFEIRRPWEESEATWKWAKAGWPWQMPGARGADDCGSRTLAVLAPVSTPVWSTFPLNEAGVALVQQWVNAPASNFGVGITKEPPNSWDLASREWATPEHRPKLTVTFFPPAK